MIRAIIYASTLTATVALYAASPVNAEGLCEGYGPQSPRDISSPAGANLTAYTLAPAASRMNLCNLHTHTNAEHKSPGFSVFAGDGEHSGWKCNEADSLTEAELSEPTGGKGASHGVKPGDTLEVHWVYSTCGVSPGYTLNACLNVTCVNPQLRVEAQVFLVVNDPNALDFEEYTYTDTVVGGLHQAKTLPISTGEPVVYAGSTTGTVYTMSKCSPFFVTWSVRPFCTKIDINSLYKFFAEGNVFHEKHSHGVRKLVTAPELLAPIE